MESEWRMNPWRLGFSMPGITLMAELLTLPGYYVHDLRDGSNRYAILTLDTARWQPWVSGGVFFIPAAHPRFPYGWAVHPDNPE